MFQRPTLLPWFDVLGNVTFPMRHKYGRVTAEERERAQRPPGAGRARRFRQQAVDELSGGMQQRVAIARALLLDPDILLMDEPFSALDALTRDEMSFELLRIWTERPKTVLFITHSIPEALLLSDRVVVMTPRPGRVREILDVPIARPRSMESLSDPVFQALPITSVASSSPVVPPEAVASAGKASCASAPCSTALRRPRPLWDPGDVGRGVPAVRNPVLPAACAVGDPRQFLRPELVGLARAISGPPRGSR